MYNPSTKFKKERFLIDDALTRYVELDCECPKLVRIEVLNNSKCTTHGYFLDCFAKDWMSFGRMSIRECEHAPILAIDIEITLFENLEQQVLVVIPSGCKKPFV